ncbi:hypothetical protein [Acetobacter oeni]|uniref:Uncharacterized protein n=1 Tax=Acetobacter oeni TaxID=304077 RepID=A0A511XJ78_9PROT|nr:hypothetical protein [Acetobacter oeni]MBB3882807.1 putative peroxiredoxin [Acetobacter oeni]NHO18897.1 hypothetical protein [Acetobacter oeni]GBR09591.1 hypothetical protein AA21952_2884 [Acetobacter oeni LMG 21952]GEN63007.1 hypothetical protein AOE01nite_12310 [Acetobacter oeni]
MARMTPEFQARQRPAAALIVATSLAAAGGLVTLVRKVMGARKAKKLIQEEVRGTVPPVAGTVAR